MVIADVGAAFWIMYRRLSLDNKLVYVGDIDAESLFIHRCTIDRQASNALSAIIAFVSNVSEVRE